MQFGAGTQPLRAAFLYGVPLDQCRLALPSSLAQEDEEDEDAEAAEAEAEAKSREVKKKVGGVLPLPQADCMSAC